MSDGLRRIDKNSARKKHSGDFPRADNHSKGRGGERGGGGKEKKHEKPKEAPVFPEGTPLDKAHKKALQILKKRPALSDGFIKERGGVWEADEVTYDRTHNEKLSKAYAYNESIMTEAERAEHKKNRAFGDILEAMLFDVSSQLFDGKVEAALTSEFDDRTNGVDLMLVLKSGDGSVEHAIGIDAATEIDVEGYDDGKGGKQKGVAYKFDRSYRNVYSDFGNLVRIKYADIDGKKRKIENVPRVLAGMSRGTISGLAGEWAEGKLDPKSYPVFGEIVRSIRLQLAALSLAARDKEQDKARGGAKPKIGNERKELHGVHTAFAQHLGLEKDNVMGSKVEDPVVHKINGVVGKDFRQRMRQDAKIAQKDFHKKLQENGSDRNKPWNAPFTEEEKLRFEEHLVSKKVPPEAVNALKKVTSVGIGMFDQSYLPMLAGGIPTRLYAHLRSLPAIKSEEPKKDKEDDGDKKPEPEDPKKGHAGEGGGHGSNSHELEDVAFALDARTSRVPNFAAHMTAVKSQYEKIDHHSREKYATKWGRAKSYIGEWAARIVGGKVGSFVGLTLGAAFCMGAWSLVPAFAGAAGAQLLLNKFLFDKKFKFKDRDKVAAVKSLASEMKRNPWRYKNMMDKSSNTTKWIEDELVLRTRTQSIWRNIGLAAMSAGVTATSVEMGNRWRTGESFFFKRLPEYWNGKRSWSELWGAFCLANNQKGNGAAAAGAVAGSGRGTGTGVVGGGQRGGFNGLTRSGSSDAQRLISAGGQKPSFRQLMGCCLQQAYEPVGNGKYRIYTGGRGHVTMFGSGRWR